MRVWLPNWDLSTIPKKVLLPELERRKIGTLWLPNWDLSSIPEKVFKSEVARRKSHMRKTKSGGVIWSEHVPNYSRCRCALCIETREARRAQPQPPKRPRGRPPKAKEGSLS